MRRGSCWKDLAVLLTVAAVALSARSGSGEKPQASGEGLAGPIVRARLDVVKDALSKANLTGDEPEKKKTIAQIIDEALEQEFPEEKVETIGKNYNETAKQEDATVETVIKVSGKQSKEEKEKKEAEKEAAETAEQERLAKEAEAKLKEKEEKEKASKSHLWNFGKSKEEKDKEKEREKEKREREKLARSHTPSKTTKPAQRKQEPSTEQEVDRIIDSQDNVYVLSKPKDSQMGLILDPQLIRDLTLLITSSGLGGMLMEAVKQPIINGYFIAGSVVGPGGLKVIKELVQVESLAQIGVQLLLFTLGLEFSLSKLRAVRSVALLGGIIEIFLFILVAGFTARMIGASVHEGIFVGALVSMSSTSIVVKCLTDAKATNSQHGQITIGTLILQDCMVGLLFAFMPVLANNRTEGASAVADIVLTVARVLLLLLGLVFISYCIARTVLPPALSLLAAKFSPELFQLMVVAFCLSCGYVTGHLGLSTELGAFVAGVMLSATEQQEHILSHLESVKAFFMALFIASTGLVMSPSFLMQHLKILAGGVLLTIFGKCLVISGVVWVFKFPITTALAVGLNMAQIGEFAFVLLSVAGNLGLLQFQVYMLLMGVTALSLLLTPFLLQGSSYILQSPVEIPGLPVVTVKDRTSSGKDLGPIDDRVSPKHSPLSHIRHPSEEDRLLQNWGNPARSLTDCPPRFLLHCPDLLALVLIAEHRELATLYHTPDSADSSASRYSNIHKLSPSVALNIMPFCCVLQQSHLTLSVAKAEHALLSTEIKGNFFKHLVLLEVALYLVGVGVGSEAG